MEQPIFAAMLSVKATELSDNEKRILEKSNPLGITLFNRNIANKIQLKKLIKDIKETIGRDNVLIGIDQEGGRVRRLKEPEYPSYAGQQTLGRLYQEVSAQTAREATHLQTKLIAQDLSEVGINLNYSPCIDLLHKDTSEVLRSRIFSNEPEIVADLGTITVNTYKDNGIIPCIKHLPGHGRAQVDPHLELPKINCSLKELEKDFYPFQKLKDCPFGMTAHIVVSEVDNEHPLTQSPQGIKELIRKIIGFEGFLISDSIDMHALKGSIEEKATLSLQAGCDSLCYCSGQEEELEALTKLKIWLTEHAMARLKTAEKILTIKNSEQNRADDLKEYQTLVGKIEAYEETYDSTEVLFKMKQKKHP